MKKIALSLNIIILLFLNVKIQGQVDEWDWVNIIDCDYNYNMSPVAGTDKNSNVYIADNFGLSADFSDTIITSEEGQIFLSKYDRLGNFKWVKTFPCGSNICDISYLTVFNSSVYVTGYFSESISMDDTTLISVDERDIFVAKFDTSGHLISCFREGGTGYDEGKMILNMNHSSEFFLIGAFSESLNIGDTTFISADNIDFYIAKYHEPNQFEWAIRGSGSGYTTAVAIGSDAENNVYITGRFDGNDLSINDFTLEGSSGVSTFLLKINPGGEISWLKNLPDPWYGFPLSMTIDPDNDVYIGGTFDASIFPQKYIMKFNPDGELLWSSGNGGYGCKSMIFAGEKIYTAGALNGKARIGSHDYFTDSIYVAAEDMGWIYDTDILAVELDQQGTAVQVVQVDDHHTEGIGETQYAWSVSHNENDIYTTGPFKGCGIFKGVDTLSGSGIFLGKLTMNNPQSIDQFDAEARHLSVYPNPATRLIHVDVSGETNPEFTLNIISLYGRIIKTIQATDNSLDVNINDLSAGFYIIAVFDPDHYYCEKFMKQ